MGKALKIVVNRRLFNTKKELRQYIIKIRDSYRDDAPLNREDFSFMLSLLKRHTSYLIKLGCGIKSMHVKHNSVFKTNREFWLIRNDYSETDFSFERCLTTETTLTKFKRACRTAVSKTTMDFKNNFFDVMGEPSLCVVTGELMFRHKNSDVDHVHPTTFNRIVELFIERYTIDIKKINITTSVDKQIQLKFDDVSVESSFINFHNSVAELRVISTVANRSLLRRKIT